MHIKHFSRLLLLSAASFATPLIKRYDLDDNGVPDYCYVDGATAHCMVSGGSWVAFPATATEERLSDLAGSTGTTVSVLGVTTTTSALSATTSVTTTTPSTTTGFASNSSTTSSSTDPAQTSGANTSTASLPSPSQFAQDKGTKWSVEYVGDLQFTGQLQTEKLGGDKCRSSKLGDKVIWNCGDMECNNDWQICGFSMGPAFYGTSSVMTIDTDDLFSVQNSDFLRPWSGDPAPQPPLTSWGMDTSNVAAINDTHGVAYAWEIWRGAPDGSTVDRGNAVASVTLGENGPVATRLGPLLTGPDAVQLGLLAILNGGDGYIYTYSVGGPSNLIVGRVPADDSVFDASAYEFLSYNSVDKWVAGIPESSTSNVGATTANLSGKFGCTVYGSVFHSDYLDRYVIMCGIYENFVNMYTSQTPYGPWSAEYQLMNSGQDPMVAGSYGVMVHHEFAPAGGSDREVYFSMGPDTVFNVFKVRFGY